MLLIPANHGCHRRPTAAMVPHSQGRGIPWSADILHNRSPSLTLENNKCITINFTIMCMTYCQQDMVTGDDLRQFQYNRFILWTYWHCPVAWFTRQWQGRQSEHGWCGCKLGGKQQLFCCIDGYQSKWWPNEAMPPPHCCMHGCCW